MNNKLILYKQFAIDNQRKLQFFLEKHSTKEGTWGILQLEEGEVDFIFLNGAGQTLARISLNKNNPSIQIPPAAWHKIQVRSDNFRANLQFYCYPHRYFSKKYNLNPVHHDLYYVYKTYFPKHQPLKIVDIGCGSGRNLLYLALLGHQMTGIDINHTSLQNIQNISEKEGFKNIFLVHHDLNTPFRLEEDYDGMVCLVTLQFLKTSIVPSLLHKLQAATKKEGIHVLITPIKADPYALPNSFNYLPASKEIYTFYQNAGWSILEYKEAVGHLHRCDEAGKFLQGMFALLVACKNFPSIKKD